MQLVIRTAHGGADVQLTNFDDDTTVGDVLAAVTGLSVPSVVSLDHRPCRTDLTIPDAIATLGLGIGSVIDVGTDRQHDGHPDGEADTPVVHLRQLTGRGAGEVLPLPLGRFRFGAGRRLAGDELSRSTVEEEAFSVAITARPRFESPDHPSIRPDEPTDVVEVSVRPGANVSGELGSYTPTLGGQLFDRELPWFAERLSVGGRVFDLTAPRSNRPAPGTSIGAARIGAPDATGARSFDAAGTLAVLDNDEPVPELPTIAALTRIDDPRRTLWRRPPSEQRLGIPIGLDGDDESRTIAIDLDRHSGVAVVGTPEFSAGLTRTVMIELTTLLGPGDLDVVIVATPGRLGRWDWAKWLPHLRGGDLAATPRFLTTDEELDEWLENADFSGRELRHPTADLPPPKMAPPSSGGLAPPTASGELPPPVGRPHARPSDSVHRRRTLVVVDDAAQWTRRESPIREFLLDPPRGALVIATAEQVADVPGACTAIVDELRPEQSLDDDGSLAATRLFGSLCRYIERQGGSPIENTGVRPSLTQTHTATRIARAMSSYDDLRVRHEHRGGRAVRGVDRPSVADLLTIEAGPDRATPPPGETGQGVGPTTVPIGTRLKHSEATAAPESPLSWDDVHTIDLAAAEITVFALEPGDSAHTLGAVTLSIAARHQPGELAILLVADREPDWVSPLPHLIGTVDAADTEQVGRVIRRVASALAQDPDFQLLVIVDDAVTHRAPDRLADAALAFVELAGSIDRVHLVMTAAPAHAETIRRHLGPRCGAFVEARSDGTATLARRDHGLETGSAVIMPTVDLVLPIARAAPPPAPSAGLRVRPFVHGRPLTPIERRLARAADRSDDAPLTPEAAAAEADQQERADRLLPPPFPDRVGLETLLPDASGRPAGSLPIGIVDRADDPGVDVYRWAPASGSLMAIGHRRSGAQTLADIVAVSLVDADAEVWVLDPLPQRRRAFRRLPQCRRTADPDSAAAVNSFLDELAERVAARADEVTDTPDALANAVRGGPAPLVLVIADMNRTLAAFDDDSATAVLERIRSLIAEDDDGRSGRRAVALATAASRHSAVAPLVDEAADVLVSDLDDDERRHFGVPDRAISARPGTTGAIVGRCWSLTRQRLVQLAAPPESLEAFIRERISQRGEESLDQPDALAESTLPDPTPGDTPSADAGSQVHGGDGS